MRFEMKMPDLATTDSPVRVVRWMAAPGQSVRRGEPLLEVETDKATMDVESVVNGVLTEIVTKLNETASAGELIAVLEVAESAVPVVASTAPASPGASPATAPIAPAPTGKPGGMFARNRQSAQAAAVKIEASGVIPLSVASRTAARRLQESKQTVPHFYLQTSANAEPMIARRAAVAPQKLVWDAFFVLAVAKAIQKFERMAYRFEAEQLVKQDADAVGVAVDIDGELYVVPIAAPAGKTPQQISDELQAAVRGLRDGDPQFKRLRPARVTVSNLGSCNVESFIPIINPPESAILGVGKIMPTPVAKDMSVSVQQRVALTLAVDHRVVSGRYAGDFLSAIVQELELS
jgi:pyruvate dehydrogenase E2 component (dihydrolipoamide acetyltransferase)